MAQVVIRRPLRAEDRVRTHISPCGPCGGRHSGIGFSLGVAALSLSVLFHQCAIRTHSSVTASVQFKHIDSVLKKDTKFAYQETSWHFGVFVR
jgi:hypothetical protein